jgi:signal peptidase I
VEQAERYPDGQGQDGQGQDGKGRRSDAVSVVGPAPSEGSTAVTNSGGSGGSEGSAEGDPAVLRRGLRLLGLVAIAAVVLVVVRLLIVQSFVIPTGSMEPTLQAGDRVLVSRLNRLFGDIHRGDVIVFDGDGVFDPARAEPSSVLARGGRAVASALGAPVGEHDYAKRVIGLPGDQVVCCDAAGRLTVNGTVLTEAYLPAGTRPSLVRFRIVVPDGRLWVMGDNRTNSADSRAHLGDPGGGTVPLDHVVGRVVVVWWPFSRVTGVGSVDATRSTTTE